MEPYQSPDFPASYATLIYFATLLGMVGLHRLGITLRRKESEAWWASTGRDALIVVASSSLSLAIWLLGIALPIALLLTCTLTLVVVLIGNSLYRRSPRTWWAVLPITLLLGAPIAWEPGSVASGTAILLQAVFPEVRILR